MVTQDPNKQYVVNLLALHQVYLAQSHDERVIIHDFFVVDSHRKTIVPIRSHLLFPDNSFFSVSRDELLSTRTC